MKIMTPLVLLAVSLLPLTATAELIKEQSINKTMETMTVTYRTPLDYALYQYTTEMLVNFRLQIQADIYHQAHSSIMRMASSSPYISVMNNPIKEKINDAE